MRTNFTLAKTIAATFLLSLFISISATAQTKATYTVKNGDTLYNISKRLNVTIAELQEWNDLSGNEIELGQTLTYYKFEEEDSSEAIADDTPPSDPLINRSSSSQTEFYIVKSGDTLYEIARKHDMSVSDLQSLNNLSGSNISIGQRLAVKKQASAAPNVASFSEESAPQGVFSVYEVSGGETSKQILSKFKMTENELEQLNPEIDLGQLNRGQEITVLLPPSRNYQNPYLQKANLQNLGQVLVSQYSSNKIGSTTTNGELYDPQLLTAAHSNIALGSIIFIENPVSGNGVYVKINDRMTNSGIKLSQKAYAVLNLSETGDPAVSIYTEIND